MRYTIYSDRAKKEGLPNVARLFTAIAFAEKVQLTLYKKAKEAVIQGKDTDLGKIQIYTVCGFTVEGDAPERCPICQAKKEMFKAF